VKFIINQLIFLILIWIGFSFIYSKMGAINKTIFYGLTIWILVLFIALIIEIAKKRKQ